MNRVLIALGTIAALFGTIIIIDPTFLATVGFSLPSVLVTVIGILALVEAIRAGYDRYSSSIDKLDLPGPEFRQVSSVPGSDFDDRLSIVTRHSRVGGVRDRNAIRNRLTETAIDVLVRYDGDTPDRARERLETGSWTDDRVAAAFFSSSSKFQPSATEWIKQTVNRDNAFRRRARRAIVVLSDRIEAGGTNDR